MWNVCVLLLPEVPLTLVPLLHFSFVEKKGQAFTVDSEPLLWKNELSGAFWVGCCWNLKSLVILYHSIPSLWPLPSLSCFWKLLHTLSTCSFSLPPIFTKNVRSGSVVHSSHFSGFSSVISQRSRGCLPSYMTMFILKLWSSRIFFSFFTFFLVIFWPCHATCGILVPTWDWTHAPAVATESPNYWVTREIPDLPLLSYTFLYHLRFLFACLFVFSTGMLSLFI